MNAECSFRWVFSESSDLRRKKLSETYLLNNYIITLSGELKAYHNNPTDLSFTLFFVCVFAVENVLDFYIGVKPFLDIK